MESNIKCLVISMLSVFLLINSSPIDGRKIIEDSHGGQLTIKDLLVQGDTPFISHSNPWASYWVYDNAKKVQSENGDIDSSKRDAFKSLVNKGDESFVGHLNPWANYWVYDTAKKVQSENEDIDPSKPVKTRLNDGDGSFVRHLNPWANYWVYDSANKVHSKHGDMEQSKIEANKDALKHDDASFVRHLNPWANYWIYDNAKKVESKDGENFKNGMNQDEKVNVHQLNEKNSEDCDKKRLNKDLTKPLFNYLDSTFVGHLNPWANYWIYDSTSEDLSKDGTGVQQSKVNF